MEKDPKVAAQVKLILKLIKELSPGNSVDLSSRIIRLPIWVGINHHELLEKFNKIKDLIFLS